MALNDDLLRIKEWLLANKLSLNVATEFLGVEIDENLSWKKHIVNVIKKVTSGIGAMRRVRDFVDRETLSSIYNALVRPHFDHCSEVWNTLSVVKNCRIELQES